MSIELKQAAQQAIDAFEAFGEADDFATIFTLTQKMNALHTAIRQAETETDESVAWIDEMLADTKEVFDANGTETPQVVRDVIEYVASWITVYNEKHRFAPGVPDDSKRLDYLQDRGATIDLIPRVAGFYPMRFRVGGLRSSANIDVRAAIDAAMLAAQAQKGGE